jgi:hypothetical protein
VSAPRLALQSQTREDPGIGLNELLDFYPGDERNQPPTEPLIDKDRPPLNGQDWS